MQRVIQSQAVKGSQRFLQELINSRSNLLNNALRSKLSLEPGDSINWLSPLKNDNYAEYGDDAFLERLSLKLNTESLRSFWPSGGPRWDALARTDRGDILLVEAKAHISELTSDCGAGHKSKALIKQSVDRAAEHFHATSPENWLNMYYQYANRLAHLYLLRHQNNISAWLVFLYFLNAHDVDGPRSVEEWKSAIEKVHEHLGLKSEHLAPYVVDVFFDVNLLL